MTIRIGGFGRCGYVRFRRRVVAWEFYRRSVPGLCWQVARDDEWEYRVWPRWRLWSVFLAWTSKPSPTGGRA